MSIFDSFNINSSGMTAQRFRMDIISENIANANTTRTQDGTPYVRKVVTFGEKGAHRNIRPCRFFRTHRAQVHQVRSPPGTLCTF